MFKSALHQINPLRLHLDGASCLRLFTNLAFMAVALNSATPRSQLLGAHRSRFAGFGHPTAFQFAGPLMRAMYTLQVTARFSHQAPPCAALCPLRRKI